MKETALIESKTLRSEYMSRTDVLDKVKVFEYMGKDQTVTIEQASNYYEVSKKTLESTIEDNRTELTQNDMRVLRGKSLKEFKESFPLKEGAFKGVNQLTIIPRRALLNIGMLLRDSEIAQRVREYLLDSEEKSISELIPKTLPEALRLAADLAEQNAVLLPKAESFDHFINADGLLSVSDAAKALKFKNVGQNNLFRILTKEGILFVRNNQYKVYQQYINSRYFEVKQRSYIHKSKDNVQEEKIYDRIYVTPRGLDWLGRYLNARGYQKIT